MAWRQIHRWLGLIAGALALVIGITGAVLALDPVIAAWQAWFPWVWISGMLAVIGFIALSRRRPPAVTIRGHRYVLDLDWVCSWLFGRRVT